MYGSTRFRPASALAAGLATLLWAGGCLVPIQVTRVEFDGLTIAPSEPLPAESPPAAAAAPVMSAEPAPAPTTPRHVANEPPHWNFPAPAKRPLRPVPLPAVDVAAASEVAPAPVAKAQVARIISDGPPHWHFPRSVRRVHHQAEPIIVAAEPVPQPEEATPARVAAVPPPAPVPLAPIAPPATFAPPVQSPKPIPFVRAQPVSAPAEVLPPSAAPRMLSGSQHVKSLREISLNITPPELVGDDGQRMASPTDYAGERFAEIPVRDGDDRFEKGFDFVPVAEGLTFCYQPLYFEEVNVERYGRNFGLLQPIVSTAHFYSRVPLIPYMVVAQPARRCTYADHWTLPGYRVPWWERHPPIISADAATWQALATYGVVLLLP